MNWKMSISTCAAGYEVELWPIPITDPLNTPSTVISHVSQIWGNYFLVCLSLIK